MHLQVASKEFPLKHRLQGGLISSADLGFIRK